MAAEVVAGALLSALIDALFKRLASPEVLNFIGVNNRSVVAELVEKLKVTLLSANALLNDAEDKQVNDANIKTWVDMLNELLSEADDIVDEINTEALRRGDVKGKSSLRRAIKPKIEKIVARLNLLLDQKGRLGLREGVRSKQLIGRSPAPLIGDSSGVYGRDGDKEAVVKLLFSENRGDEVSVIPIVGMGGVGKTTLARLVYDDQKVKNHFENRVWVTVSDDFDVFRLAKQVFEGLSGVKSESKELGKLQDEMVAFLCGKMFLLVLDDVWNENYNLWNAFKSFLTSGAEGIKIIVTTRSDSVASMMGGALSLPLETLSDEDCWQLFKRHAFRTIHVGEDLEDVGKKIVEKCKGLPLAVMSLAGLLCSVSNKKEWEAVLNSDVWGLHEKGNDEIIPSLWLSYSYLPSHLKRCFAYCSIFPKDYEYDKKKIILLWMAEGLLQGENMEDVGEEYFKTLISRSLFQRSTNTEPSVVMHDLVRDLATFVSGLLQGENMEDVGEEYFNTLISRSLIQRSTNTEPSVVMHDLVHDLATFVSGKGFCVRFGVEHSLSSSLTIKTRHLLYKNSFPEMENFKGLSEAKCLRTLMPWGLVHVYDNPVNCEVVVKKFRCLRVLCLPYSRIKKVTKSIGKLKHLRYLDLSNNIEIKRLPDAVCSLYSLQTLLLNGCLSLTELPANMGRLLNLRHLDLRGTDSLKRMPLSNWNLKGLRTLTKLVLNDTHSISKIKELKEHSPYYSDGSFEIVVLENDFKAEFKNKSGITEMITLGWSSSRSGSSVEKDRATLDAFKPHVSLKKLNIINYGGTELSDWVGDGSLTNLQFLEIKEADDLQRWSLEGVAFRYLKELRLYKCRQMEVLSCGQMNTRFPSLVNLAISKCPKLEITGLPLPSSLENLWIWNCEKLMAQHMQWGLLTTSLKELRIIGCKGLMDTFPEEGLLPTTLQKLTIINAPNMKALNGNAFQHLTSLNELDIWKCPKLEFAGLPLPSSLENLCIKYDCEKLMAQRMQWGLLTTSLKELTIQRCNEGLMGTFPEEGLLPTTLQKLTISDAPNMKALNGNAFQHLTSLTHLTIIDCPKLECLPEQGLPASLTRLEVYRCPQLEARLQRETGQDRHKISHVRTIRVDFKDI